jgi:hypothetical protein
MKANRTALRESGHARTATAGRRFFMLLKKGKHMRLQTTLPDAKIAPICAHCRVEMVAVHVQSIQLDDGHADITYRCGECGGQQTRTTRPVWST